MQRSLFIIVNIIGLSSSPQKCLQSITGVLHNFHRIFGENGLFQTNDASVTKMVTDVHTVVKEILNTLGVSEMVQPL